MISVLEFINRVRAAQGLPPTAILLLAGADPDDENWDVVGLVLGAPTGESRQQRWARDGRWVMRFASAEVASLVARATGCDWSEQPPEVALPEALVDLAVSHSNDVVVGDEQGNVRGWWVPDEQGFPRFRTPTEPLVPDVGPEPPR